MSNKLPVDLDPFDPNHDDEAKIMDDEAWVPCRLCKQIFYRMRITYRFCKTCKRAFCEGEHGSFTGGRGGVCVRCYSKHESELA